MKIDEIDAIEAEFRRMCPFPVGPNDPPAKHDLAALIRLARLGLKYEKIEQEMIRQGSTTKDILDRQHYLHDLGLWAEEHGIPAVKRHVEKCGTGFYEEKALSALPKP